jgi:hypothetical protein
MTAGVSVSGVNFGSGTQMGTATYLSDIIINHTING